jgi:TolB-like protein
MIKKLFFAALFCLCALAVFGQAGSAAGKPRLGILPFAGGESGEGEIIATLFSSQGDILQNFTVVPRTAAVNALVAEQNFQLSGYTDSDTIARLGRMLNADFVVSGHIRRLGGRSLVVATIVDVETFEQLAGDYREYRDIGEVPAMLPEISKKLIAGLGRKSAGLPKLAVVPFNILNKEAGLEEAESLAQILAIEIANTGKYAVLPRTATLLAAMNELEYQMSGYTAEEGAKALGRAANAEYVLSADVGSLGTVNLFTAQILHVEDGTLLIGGNRRYGEIGDGIVMMEELALLLTDKDAASALIARRRRDEARRDLFANPARLWSVGASIGSAMPFEPWLIATVRGTAAPFKYCFAELGFDYGAISGNPQVKYYYLFPYGNIAGYLPFERMGVYAGAGFGYLISAYLFPEGPIQANNPTLAIFAGINLFNMIDVSYTFRATVKNAGQKISVGYVYRFK